MTRFGRWIILYSSLPSILFAQGTARVTGSVIDPSSAAVPGAAVELLLHGGKRALLSTRTGPDGLFSIESVRPELYDLVIEAPGFQPYKLENVKVDSARATDLPPLKLLLAAAAASVDVTAGAETVQTTSTEISTTVTMDQIRRLPVGDRNHNSSSSRRKPAWVTQPHSAPHLSMASANRSAP